MLELDINTRARQLLDTYGSKAIADAARKAAELEAHGETEEAQSRRRVEKRHEADARTP